jgi:IS30 family transposase
MNHLTTDLAQALVENRDIKEIFREHLGVYYAHAYASWEKARMSVIMVCFASSYRKAVDSMA